MEHFDIVVIGSGPGGYRAAILAALAGKKVGIVEKAAWGGCCLNRGCVPKKAWHHTARLMDAVEQGAARGLVGTLRADLATAWLHQQRIVDTVRENYISYLERLGVIRLEGTGSLVDARTVAVRDAENGTQTVTSDYVILATGSTPKANSALPETAGRIISTDTLFEQPPPTGRRVAVVGGGVIGVEFAYILQRFGFEISWFTGGPLLSRAGFSAQAMNVLRQSLHKHGITSRMGRPKLKSVTDDGVLLATESEDVSRLSVAGTRSRTLYIVVGLGHHAGAHGREWIYTNQWPAPNCLT